MAAAKKRPTAKTSKTANTKKSVSSQPKLSLGIVAIVIGALILLGGLYVLFSQAASQTYKLADGSTITRRFPGDPNPKVSGKAYWGASIGGNSDPARHESPTGKSLSVRRTFWGWDNNRTSMITTIKADLTANRLPWVSTKTPKWAEVAAGQHDAVLDDMLRKIDATGGPVWLTVYHEPEDNTRTGTGREKCEQVSPDTCDGTAADWRAMQKHFRDRMNAIGTKNITLAPILMSWTWDSRSGRTPSDYWISGIWDFMGVDHYQNSGPDPIASMTAWKNFVAFTESKGLPYGIGEWGTTEDATASQRMRDFWQWSFANKKDLVAYAYFDSLLNSTLPWELSGTRIIAFQDIMKNDTRVQRIRELGTPTASSSSPLPTTTLTPAPTTTVTPAPTTTVTPAPTTTVTPAPTTTVTPPPAADVTAPSAPTNVKGNIVWDAFRFSYYTNLSWGASTDNVGVTSYVVKRNGSTLGTPSATNFQDYGITANTIYNYEIQARDAAGNTSTASSARLVGRCFLIWCWGE